MKKLLYIPIIASLFFISPACNKKLEVSPQNDATPDQIKTSSDVEAVLNGGYAQLQSYSAFGEQLMLIPDLLASDAQVDWAGTYANYKQVWTKKIVSTNSIASSIWGNAYKIIGIANTVLDKISIVDSADRDNVKGQALWMRGTMYFELVSLYGKPYSDGNASSNLGVPIVLDPVYAYDSTKNKPARSTVAATYTQILADLKAAESLLPESNDIKVNLYAAKAMLARVYMSMLDYTNAASEANDVITNSSYTLNATFDKAFNNASNSQEDIFAIQQTSQSNAGTSNQGINTFYCPYGGLPSGQTTGRGDAQVDAQYADIFESADFRGSYFTSGYSISGIDGTYTNKWQFFYRVIPVLRLSEMYLTRGEANLMAGTTVGASPDEDINTVRARAGASTITGSLIQDFIDERFRELGFEGDRFWTLKRNQQDIDGYGYDDDKMILPIPKSETDVNANLTQNNGY